MKIHFDKLYKDDRVDELLGIGIPFKKGHLPGDALDRLSIYDGDARLPVQSKITSTWEDGSVRFAYVRFLGTLPGNKGKDFEVRILQAGDNTSSIQDDTHDNIILKSDEGAICLSNGCVSFNIGGSKEQLFDSLSYGDKEFSGDFFEGPYFKFAGKELSPVFDSSEVVEEGPLFTILERKGHYEMGGLEPSGEGIKFELRLMVAASKPWVEVSYRLFNCTDKTIEPDLVRAFIRGFDLEKSEIKTTCGISNYKTRFTESETGEKVELLITAEMLEKEANEHFGEVFYGTFLGDVTDKTRNFGICATVFQAQQNFPKAISASRGGIEIGLLPDKEETMKLSKAQPVRFESGMAREQRFLLHFHSGDEDRYELNNRSIIYQMPDTGYLDPKVYEEAGVFFDIFLDEDKQIDDVEISLIDKADAHARCYGMLCWGDGPDPGYTSQGRGGGDLVWTNNEYDYPHAMYMMYARTGIRRFLDYANVACWHWMDVDICHYNSDPIYLNGQWEHMRKHTGGSESGQGSKGIMACSHEWVEGLLDYYHFTGDERAFHTAIGIGENVLALLETPEYQAPGEISARETGWALRSLTALFVETHDEKWLSKADWIISQFEKWNERYGNWLSPYTDNTTIRVGFMISVAVGSIMRYYRARPSDRLKNLMMKAIDDIVDNCRTPHGLFYYKELPSLSRNGNNTLLLESMAIGYELTGDDRYLDYGIRTFKKAISGGAASITGKRIVEDAVIMGNGAPKNFAQSFFPITYFYVKAVVANKLLH